MIHSYLLTRLVVNGFMRLVQDKCGPLSDIHVQDVKEAMAEKSKLVFLC